MAHDDGYRYWVPVDLSAPNNAHVFALQMIGRDQDVLELGCATGHVSKVLVEQGCAVVGVERDEQAARAAALVAGEVLVVDLFAADNLAKVLADRSFDVVYAGDVLEHLPDPLGVLVAACQSLRAGGAVVLSVPNIAHIDVRMAMISGRFDYQDYGLLDRTHLRFFTKASLLDLLHQAGLHVVELRRVLRPPFETELAVPPDAVPEALLLEMLADPEAQTYQFVVRAVPRDSDPALDLISQRVLEVDAQLADERAARLVAQRERDDLLERVAELQPQADALHALQQTKTFRMTAGLRRLYGLLRGTS